MSPNVKWDDIRVLNPSELMITDVKTLYKKIEDSEIEHQVSLLKEQARQNEKEEIKCEPMLDFIEFEDFIKADLRIVKVVSAEKVKKSNKLLKLKVKCGDKELQVLSGIAKHYEPDELVGKDIVMIINLKPRKMMGEMSEGMILSAQIGEDLSVLVPDKTIQSGAKLS